MSDPQHHDSLIKTPKQLIVTVVAAFLVPIVIITLLVSYVTSERKLGAGGKGMSAQAVAERIAPIAKFEIVDSTAPRVMKEGKAVFEGVCSTCHGAGIAGAPKVGDTAAWSARVAQGAATLYDHAIKGYTGKAGVMPAKGGNPELDDYEVQRAVVYMANASGGKLAEPAALEKKEAAVAVASAPPLPVADANAVAQIAAINAGKAPGAAPAAAAATTTVAAAGADNGKKTYDAVCMACHAAGVAGAPKFADKAAWTPRIAEGLDTLYEHAIKGYKAMPPKGGATTTPDDDVKAAVRYMADAAK